MPVDFSGTWNLHSSDNFEGYMLALGRQRGPRRGGAVGGGARVSGSGPGRPGLSVGFLVQTAPSALPVSSDPQRIS